MSVRYNSSVKVWRWLTASALWFAMVVAWTFDFHERHFGGFGVVVPTEKYLTPRIALALASTLFYLILFGWIIPLCVGLWRLTLRLTHRLCYRLISPTMAGHWESRAASRMVKKLILAARKESLPDRRLMPLPAHSTSADHRVVPCNTRFLAKNRRYTHWRWMGF